MVLSTTSWLLTAAIIASIAFYITLLVKLKSAKETPRAQQPSDIYDFSESLQENNQPLPETRRKEMLKKIKEERIKEYLDHKK